MKHEELLKEIEEMHELQTVMPIYGRPFRPGNGDPVPTGFRANDLKQLAADYRRAIEVIKRYEWIPDCDGDDSADEFLKGIGEGE